MNCHMLNLPPLAEIDWQLIADSHVVLVGAGAVGRPLARGLAQLGLRRATIIDPKRYREQSIRSQCSCDEVGRLKAEVIAQELAALGVQAVALPQDVEQVPPGYFDQALVIVSVDNRRAEILSNRQAGRMRRPLLKVNIEPLFLTASIRFYDFSHEPTDVCLECQMSEAHYADQQHPLSCDGERAGRSTASPRPLCEFAANAGALVAVQILGSPQHWAEVWRNRQWQANLLGGQSHISQLPPKTDCRWDHTACWPNLTRIHKSSKELTLAELLLTTGCTEERAHVRFSSMVATRLRCDSCEAVQPVLRSIQYLDENLGRCPCGGTMRAVPFFSFDYLAAAELKPWLKEPLDNIGMRPGSVITVGNGIAETSFLV
jgi:molybdopterin/thiamine biosynthesis adenylyltransferase